MKDLDFGIGASGKLQAILLLALGIFMGSLGVGIVSAPMHMSPILSILLKAFIGLVFGGIAAGCALFAYRSIQRDPGLPADLLARCLTCGEKTPNDLVCPVCGELPQDRKAAFHIKTEEWLVQLFGMMILTGVGCLGVFIIIGPYLDGERRWWALVAFFALGLLLFIVGAAGFLGLVLSIGDRIRGAKEITFSCRGPDRFTQGQGKLAWGKLVGLQGNGTVKVPVAATGKSEGGYRVSPGDVALAEALATFDAAGFIELNDVTTYDWSVGDPSGKNRSLQNEFTRKINRQILVRHCLWAGPYCDEDADDVELEKPISEKNQQSYIARYLFRYLGQPVDLIKFRNKLDADLVYRAQLEMHARSLRDQGIAVSNELVQAVIEGLLRESQSQKTD